MDFEEKYLDNAKKVTKLYENIFIVFTPTPTVFFLISHNALQILVLCYT